jgi:hypothetical protein
MKRDCDYEIIKSCLEKLPGSFFSTWMIFGIGKASLVTTCLVWQESNSLQFENSLDQSSKSGEFNLLSKLSCDVWWDDIQSSSRIRMDRCGQQLQPIQVVCEIVDAVLLRQ